MAASEGTARQWREVTGCVMIEGWGMSETCAIGTNNPLDSTEFSGAIGLPLPGIDIAIKDDAGESLATGETGEICIRGRTSRPATTGSPRKTREHSRRMATCAPATSAPWTRRAISASSTARRT